MNKWIYNNDFNKWSVGNDVLNKTDYDSLKEDLKKLRFYQKCLSGSTYVSLSREVVGVTSSSNIDNIYDILDYQSPTTYYYSGLPYIQTPTVPNNPSVINTESAITSFTDEVLSEYNFTLKNLFTPNRLINDQKDNLYYVDLATTERIVLEQVFETLVIDGIRVLDGHRILVKDQYVSVTILSSIDPDTYFYGKYEIDYVIGLNTVYKIPSYTNGIYLYKNKQLVRTDDLDIYADIIKYSICVKLGIINREEQFRLTRLNTGFFPKIDSLDTLYTGSVEIGDSIWFENTHNYVLRNRVDYNNLYELVLYDTIKHATQSISVNITLGTQSNTILYTVPERVVTVGEFGTIFIHQDGITNVVNTKWKVNYRSISETNRYYWICGDNGLLIRVDKSDLKIEKIYLDIITQLNSVSFFDDLHGVVVGKFNQIFVTSNGGKDWEQILLDIFDGYHLQKVIYKNIDKFYIGGDNGLFAEFTFNLGKWLCYRRRISKYVDGYDDEFIYLDDIKDMHYFVSNNNEFIAICGELNNIYLYDINKVLNLFSDFIFIQDTVTNNVGDISSITWVDNYGLYFSSFENLYQIDPFSFLSAGATSNIISTTFSVFAQQSSINKVFTYGNELIITGNLSLWKKSFVTATFSNTYDSTFFDRLKPKLLFTDYDIGSKLYWFDDYGQYRLPERLQVPISYIQDTGNSTYIGFNENENSVFDANTNTYVTYSETNWISYWKDRLKTFEYYTSLEQAYVVEPSFTFSTSDTVGMTFTYATSSITTDYNEIVNLIPSAIPLYQAPNIDQISRYREIVGTPIIAPTNIFDLYFYDYMGIWCINTLIDVPEVGDVIEIESDIFGGRFIVNKVLDFAGYTYIYFYTDFSSNVINNIPNSITGFTIRDLNKYPSTTNSYNYFIDNFKKHYIDYAYDCELVTDNYPPLSTSTHSFQITAKYSQMSSYYNLQTRVDILSTTASSYTETLLYPSGFLNFGYTPTYNLLSYLNYIDPYVYIPGKEFLAMPNWLLIPGPDSGQLSIDLIYIDTGLVTNKLVFGFNLKYIWESLLINTFVDINIDGPAPNNNVLTQRLLIIDKYIEDDTYIIEFHDSIDYSLSNNINTIDILSRRTLQQISDDLQYINRIHRPKWLVSESWDKTSANTIGTWSNYETNIDFKIPTDSYTKILLSDASIIKDLTGILYTDYKYDLALQIISLDKKYEFHTKVISVGSGVYRIYFSQLHGLRTNDVVLIGLDNVLAITYPEMLGIHTITVVNDYIVTFTLGSTLPINDNALISYVKKDHFLNYQPIDLFDLGISDKKIKQSIEIKTDNYEVVSSNYNIINIDLNKYRFRLVGGLDLISLNTNWPWILEAEITDAVIGIDKNDIIWYKGIWECGRWFGGRWVSGKWVSGDWYSGTWTSKVITDNYITVSVDEKRTNNTESTWYGGRWFDGVWENGKWYSGRWYAGTWNDGIWFDGTWNDGTWEAGEFKSGIWVLGTWNNGVMNTSNGMTYWLDGKFNGGDFENGIWYNGVFDQKNDKISRFGTKANNTRNAIWRSGKFIEGEFHSAINGKDVSLNHSYSKWLTGIFMGGNFYGGVTYNIDFRNTVWNGGISEDIEVVQLTPTTNSILLVGDYPFNINDSFYLVDDGVTGTYSMLQNPQKYKVLDTTYDSVNDQTLINISVNMQSFLGTSSIIIGASSSIRCVSSFNNAYWKSGVWFNGVFENGVFSSGLWYDGYFDGTWG